MKNTILGLIIVALAGPGFAADSSEQINTARTIAHRIHSDYGVPAGLFRCDPLSGRLLTTMKPSTGEVCVYVTFTEEVLGHTESFEEMRLQYQIPLLEGSIATAKSKIDNIWVILQLTSAKKSKPGAGVHN